MVWSKVRQQGRLVLQRLDASPQREVLDALELLAPVNVGVPLRRIGGQADGGYLVPEDLDDVEALLSPGVADRWTFEAEVGNQYGIPAYLIDGSVAAPEGLTDLQHFEPKYLGKIASDRVVTLDDWVSQTSKQVDSDLLLQMDIEGHEYGVLQGVSELVLRRFRVVIIEFHKLDQLAWRPALRRRIAPALERMAAAFDVVHVHPNNCCPVVDVHGVAVPQVLEVTYLRKDRRRAEPIRTLIPHALDQDCVPLRKPIVLPATWPG